VSGRTMRISGDRGGFTLIEVIVIIAIISILASIGVPYAFKFINQEREDATKEEMKELHRAIMGDPTIGDGGYVSDMGTLPVNNELRALNEQNFGAVNQPNPQTDANGVKYGWWGPYANVGFDPTSYLEDSWGLPYAYGDPGAGQIRSLGPDRTAGTSDDIIYPPNPVDINGRLLINVFVWDKNKFVENPQRKGPYKDMEMDITVFYSDLGSLNSVTVSVPPPGNAPPLTFIDLHQGQHSVTGNCDLDGNQNKFDPISGVAVVYVRGNSSQTILDLYLE